MEKRKRAKISAVHLPHHPAYTNIPTRQPANDTTNIRTTHSVGIAQPIALLTHPFDACIKAARNTGFAEGLTLRAQEVRELVAKLRSFERHIAQLEGRLRGNQIVEAEKMGGDPRHHCETTDGASNAPTTTNKTVVAVAHVFNEFVPGAPFHPLISHSTTVLPTNPVIPLRANSLLKHEHQPPPKSPNPWDSLALRHVRCTRQKNLSFHTPIYTIPARRSTFAPIASALALA
jgi:hypothetical protein